MAEVQVTVEEFYTAIGKLFFALQNEEKKNLALSTEVARLSSGWAATRSELTTATAVRDELRRENEKIKAELAVPRSRKKP